jgi:putative ABC transport system ATP-binding protein
MAEIPVVEARGLSRTFDSAGVAVHAVREVSLAVSRGEFVALVGPSGCGKSTLLSMLGLIEVPSAGEVILEGRSLLGAHERVLQGIRRARIGFVFQAFNLLSTLSVEENVMLPCILNGIPEEQARESATEILRTLNLESRSRAMPTHLSGGEMQRVAIARAVAHRPALVIADEPTGNLDSVAGESVLSVLSALHTEGISIIMATHSDAAVARASRILRMRDGAVIDES